MSKGGQATFSKNGNCQNSNLHNFFVFHSNPYPFGVTIEGTQTFRPTGRFDPRPPHACRNFCTRKKSTFFRMVNVAPPPLFFRKMSKKKFFLFFVFFQRVFVRIHPYIDQTMFFYRENFKMAKKCFEKTAFFCLFGHCLESVQRCCSCCFHFLVLNGTQSPVLK